MTTNQPPPTSEQLTTLLETVEGRRPYVYNQGGISGPAILVSNAERNALCAALRELQAENERLRKDTENSVKVNRATITGLRDEAANLTAECAALREQLASSEAQRDTDSAKAIKVLELFSLACEQLASSEGRVDRLTSQLEGHTGKHSLATEQTWCDHCSADLGVRHILCERCYREYAAAPPALAAAQPPDESETEAAYMQNFTDTNVGDD